MIDTHCHILPAVDDGSDSLQTSMMMAAMAADDGEKAIIATPHVTWEEHFSLHTMQKIKHTARIFKKALQDNRIPLHCFVGAEVLLMESGMKLFDTGLFPTIENTNYALVEFLFDESIPKMETYLEAMVNAGVYPIIAHPERYTAIQRKPSTLVNWSDRGYSLQINKGSIHGQFGRKAKKVAQWMMEEHLADLWGTDAHNVTSRTTRIAKAKHALVELYGEEYVKLITEENPLQLLQNKPLMIMR